MQRKLGFNQRQQCHADESMWMESQGQQQSYAFHEESWSSDNNCHNQKQFPGRHMNMNNRLGAFAADSELSMQKQHGKLGGMRMNRLGDFAMDSELSMQKHHGKFGGSHGMFQEGMHNDHGFGYAHHGGVKNFPFGANNASHHFSNGGGHQEYFSEETEYEDAYTEDHVGAVTAKVDEMRYQQQHKWGGDTCYANPYDRNINHKPHKFQWTAKGV